MSEAAMELIKGAKKAAIGDELAEGATEVATEEVVDLTKMTVAQIDELVVSSNLSVPDDWKKMNKAQKIAYLEEAYGDEESGDAAEKGDDATAVSTVEAPVVTASEEPVTAATVVEDPDATKEAAKALVASASPKSKTKVAKVAEQEILPPDDISMTVHEIENLKEDEAKDMVKKLTERTAFDQFRLGGVLSVISANQWHKPFATFKEFVESELGMKHRRAMYWIKIYNMITDSGIAWEKVKHVGWTKLKELVDVLTPDNTDWWLSAIDGKNTITIQQMVKSALADKAAGAVSEDEEDGKVKVITNMSFKVHVDQKATIEAAIEKAKEAGATQTATVALEYICADFLSGDTKAMWQRLQDMGIDEALKALDKAFPDLEISVTGAVNEAA